MLPIYRSSVWWFLQPIHYCKKINRKILGGQIRAKTSHDLLENTILFSKLSQYYCLIIPGEKNVNWFIRHLVTAFQLESWTKPLGKRVLCKGNRYPSSINLYKLKNMPCKFQLFFHHQPKDRQTFCVSYFQRAFFFPLLGRGTVYKG